MPIGTLTEQAPHSILLTGVTGFVGRFLLTQLLEDTRATLYCVVRAQSEHLAAKRIRDNLAHWDLWLPAYESRIVALPGDLRQPRLGLRDDHYQSAIHRIESIYHCGASVNHLETYQMAKAANVTATQEIIKIASQGTQKPLHHISTIGVFSAPEDGHARVVFEDSSIEHENHRYSNGYLASKWVAEDIVMKARDRGVTCNIFRLGLMWSDSRNGRFDERQHVYRLIKSCLLMGCGIENYRYEQDPIPVDYAASAIVALASRYHGKRATFHIASSVQSSTGLFERCNQVLYTPLTLLPFYDWLGEVKRLHKTGRSLPIVPLIEYAFPMSRQELMEHLNRNDLSRVRVNCERTWRELAEIGIRSPELSQDLLTACLERMVLRDKELRRFSLPRRA